MSHQAGESERVRDNIVPVGVAGDNIVLEMSHVILHFRFDTLCSSPGDRYHNVGPIVIKRFRGKFN